MKLSEGIKPKTCPYCNEELTVEEDYCYVPVDETKLNFDLKNMKPKFFYKCKNCSCTVGNIDNGEVRWVSKEEAYEIKNYLKRKMGERLKYTKIVLNSDEN